MGKRRTANLKQGILSNSWLVSSLMASCSSTNLKLSNSWLEVIIDGKLKGKELETMHAELKVVQVIIDGKLKCNTFETRNTE